MSLVYLCKDAGYPYQQYEARILESTTKLKMVSSGPGKKNLSSISSGSMQVHSANTKKFDITADKVRS